MRSSTGNTASIPAAQQDVIAWRADRMRAAGFDEESALYLAADGRYDLHALLELLDRGCPPAVAIRILAPIESEAGR
jgi:hypothetical protein